MLVFRFGMIMIMRIFKLAWWLVGLQSIPHTVCTSWMDLGLLFMLWDMSSTRRREKIRTF